MFLVRLPFLGEISFWGYFLLFVFRLCAARVCVLLFVVVVVFCGCFDFQEL